MIETTERKPATPEKPPEQDGKVDPFAGIDLSGAPRMTETERASFFVRMARGWGE